MIEIPDSVVAELSARKVNLETRAYEIASEIRHADRSNKPESHMSLMSCTKGKVKNLDSLGEPSLLTAYGGDSAVTPCLSWVPGGPGAYPQSASDASRAPSLRLLNFAHTISGSTSGRWPALRCSARSAAST